MVDPSMSELKSYHLLPTDEQPEPHPPTLEACFTQPYIVRGRRSHIFHLSLYSLLVISNFTFLYLWLKPQSDLSCIRPELIFCTAPYSPLSLLPLTEDAL